MSTNLRNRKPTAFTTDAPPVPPKPSVPLNPPSTPSLSQRRGRIPPAPPQQLKPLPPVPQPSQLPVLEAKPLPRPPAEQIRYGATGLWVFGFVVWFLVVVVMLPVIMEREAMIGANAWLKGLW